MWLLPNPLDLLVSEHTIWPKGIKMIGRLKSFRPPVEGASEIIFAHFCINQGEHRVASVKYESLILCQIIFAEILPLTVKLDTHSVKVNQ